MIYQQFTIPKYNWEVQVYYFKTTYYARDILENLLMIGCDTKSLLDARENLMRESLDSGLCYSNYNNRQTIIVIARTSSPELFMNSWMHESKHLLSHMEQACGIDPYSEKAAYLFGYIAQMMFKKAKRFLCNCYK